MTDNDGKRVDQLPLGEPHLAWSFNRDGEADPVLMDRRDHNMGTDTKEVRRERQDFVPLAHPQSGVDDLKGKFSGNTQSIPGVMDIKNVRK